MAMLCWLLGLLTDPSPRLERRFVKSVAAKLFGDPHRVVPVGRTRIGSFDHVKGFTAQKSVGQERCSGLSTEFDCAVVVKRISGFTRMLLFFLPDNSGLGSKAFDLDFQFRYLRHCHSPLLKLAGLATLAGRRVRVKYRTLQLIARPYLTFHFA